MYIIFKKFMIIQIVITFQKKQKSVENLAEKLIVNFEKNSEQNLEEIGKINIYSKEIFDNVIREYDKFIK